MRVDGSVNNIEKSSNLILESYSLDKEKEKYTLNGNNNCLIFKERSIGYGIFSCIIIGGFIIVCIHVIRLFFRLNKFSIKFKKIDQNIKLHVQHYIHMLQLKNM